MIGRRLILAMVIVAGVLDTAGVARGASTTDWLQWVRVLSHAEVLANVAWTSPTLAGTTGRVRA